MNGLDSIRGKHTGRGAVVMGAGPSLCQVDERVHRHVTIAVNSAILKVPDADYIVTSDYGMVEYKYWQVVRDVKCPIITPRGTFHEFWYDPDFVGRFVFFNKRDKSKWKLTRNDQDIVFGLDSVHCAVNVAVVLGCSPIYLVGCDCLYRGGKRYAWEIAGDRRGEHISGLPMRYMAERRKAGYTLRASEYQPSSSRVKDGQLGASMHGWREIKRANPNLKIISASGGRLRKVFSQTAMSSVLGEDEVVRRKT